MASKDMTPEERMIESVVSDYLKRNPGVERKDVMVQTIGGKLVVRSIKKTFGAIPLNARKKQAASPQFQSFLNEISRSGGERLEDCLESINGAKAYLAWMSHPRYTHFEKDEQDNALQALDVLEDQAHQAAGEMQNLHDQFSETINGGIRPAPSLIQTWVQEYMQTVLSQLKCKHRILQNELNLGDRFETCVKHFMSENVPEISGKPDPVFIKALAKAVIILKNNGVEAPDVHDTVDAKALEAALKQFHDKLQDRRRTLDQLNMLISHIELFVEQMQLASSEDKSSENENGEKKSTHRMAFRGQPRRK